MPFSKPAKTYAAAQSEISSLSANVSSKLSLNAIFAAETAIFTASSRVSAVSGLSITSPFSFVPAPEMIFFSNKSFANAYPQWFLSTSAKLCKISSVFPSSVFVSVFSSVFTSVFVSFLLSPPDAVPVLPPLDGLDEPPEVEPPLFPLLSELSELSDSSELSEPSDATVTVKSSAARHLLFCGSTSTALLMYESSR